MIAEAATNFHQLTPVHDLSKIIFFRIPLGGSAVHTFFQNAAIDLFSNFQDKNIQGYNVECSSDALTCYSFSSGVTACNSAKITVASTTFTSHGGQVVNNGVNLTVYLEEFKHN